MKRITDVECLVPCTNEIGEGPVWRPEEQALYWVDCPARKLQRYDLATGAVKEWTLSRMPGSLTFRRDKPGILMASRNGLSTIDLDTGEEVAIEVQPLVNFAEERFNDGKCDRAGRFWTGTIDRLGHRPVGSLYRIDPDLSIRKMDSGIISSNGISWSLDNKTMYYCDSRAALYAYDYDIATGEIANRRIHIDLLAQGRHPDGCTVDAEGFLWIAEPDSSCVRRYDPEGKLEREVVLPVTKPASCTFGGPNYETLFITTLRIRMDAAELAAQPLAGALFATHPGVCGLPEPLFAG